MTHEEAKKMGATHSNGDQYYKYVDGWMALADSGWCRIATIGKREYASIMIHLMTTLKPL